MNKLRLILLSFILFISCRKPYTTPAIVGDKNYLVVEGQISTGTDSTIITLSRTVTISSTTSSKPELNAQLFVENDQNSSYPVGEVGNGKYAALLNLPYPGQYRLRIKTTDGKYYLSDLVEAKTSPPIDSVGFTIQNNGVQLYLNTHDPLNNTRYYRWDYDETWMFHSAYDSFYKTVNRQLVYRAANEEVYICWGNEASSTIILNTTAHLVQDVVFKAPIDFIPSTSEKLEYRFSILVRQYALTPAAFNYFQNLKTNTEQLGSIFDAQPSELPSNLHCLSNPSEPVIGYLTAGTVTQKRIYIDNSQVPAWTPYTFYDSYGCADDTIRINTAAIDYDFGSTPPRYTPILSGLAGPTICIDCTLRGTNIQPAFWK